MGPLAALYQLNKRIGDRFRTRLPLTDIRSLVYSVTSLNYATLNAGQHNVEEVFELIRRITSERMGIDLLEIQKESSFSRDLGID